MSGQNAISLQSDPVLDFVMSLPCIGYKEGIDEIKKGSRQIEFEVIDSLKKAPEIFFFKIFK